MNQIVFYSWQSDLPNACNRGFIQDALESAATAITADDTVAIEPVVDRDTQGVPGAPDIASTIFAKIAAADVFVADRPGLFQIPGSRAICYAGGFPDSRATVGYAYGRPGGANPYAISAERKWTSQCGLELCLRPFAVSYG